MAMQLKVRAGPEAMGLDLVGILGVVVDRFEF